MKSFLQKTFRAVISLAALVVLGGCSMYGSITVPLKASSLKIAPGAISNQSIPKFNGTGRPLATATLYVGSTCSGTPLASSIIDLDGHFSITPTTPLLTDGTYVFSLKFQSGTDIICQSPGTYTLDRVAPTATLVVRAAQANPASSFPVNFDLTFSKKMDATSVTSSIVAQAGTATGVVWTVTDSGDHIHFGVSAIAAGSFGTIVPSILASTTKDPAGNGNTLATHGLKFHVSYGLVVLPLYEVNGGDLFDYVVNDGASRTLATDLACTGTETGYFQCLHGGEYKVAVVPGLSTCAGLTATDALSAFNWTCRVVAGKVQLVTSGFIDGVGLRTLLNSSGSALRSNYLTLSGSSTLASAPLNWWPLTSVAPLVDNSASATMINLTTPRTINTLTTSRLSGGYSIQGNKIAVVTLPGATLGYNGSGTYNCKAFDYVSATYNLTCLLTVAGSNDDWVEADLNGYHASNAVHISLGTLNATRFVLLNSKSRYSNWRIELTNLKNSYVNHFQSFNSMDLGSVVGNWLNDLTFWGQGFGINGSVASPSTNNHISNVTMFSVGGDALQIQGTTTNNSFSGFLIAGPSGNCMNLSGAGVAYNTYSRFTLLSTYAGNDTIGDYISGHQIFQNFAIANSGNHGMNLGSSTGHNTYSQLAVVGSNYTGIQQNSQNLFDGTILVGFAGTGNACFETVSNAGLANSTCAAEGFSLSSTSLSVGVSSATGVGSFVGPITSDSVNTSFVGGLATYPAVISTFDATGFQNKFRFVMAAGDASFPSYRGNWYTGSGQIYDASLRSTDTYFLNKSGNGSTVNAAITNGATCPAWLSGNTTVTDLDATHVYLKNAYEVAGDPQGNDNGLCESGEICIAAPNIGAYQGHGDYTTKSCAFQDGTITGVTMYAYPTNGY